MVASIEMRHVSIALLLCACSSPAIFGSSGPAGGGGVGGAGAGGGDVGGEAPAASVTSSTTSSTTTSTTSGPGGMGGVGGSPQPECFAPDDCPGTDGECSWRSGVAHAPAETPLAAQTAGDCYTATCGADVYTPTDAPSVTGECVAGSHCTPAGPVVDNEPTGTWCTGTCGCPELNGGVCGASSSGVTCTRGLCEAGTCVDAIPVTCKVGVALYTRCDLTAGANRISWGAGTLACEEPGVCSCSALAYDVGYCAAGTVCYVYDADGVWLGPTLGTGVCQ